MKRYLIRVEHQDADKMVQEMNTCQDDIPKWLAHFIEYAKNLLAKQHVGSTITIGGVPIYETSWHGPGQPSTHFSPNPVAEYWRRKVIKK